MKANDYETMGYSPSDAKLMAKLDQVEQAVVLVERGERTEVIVLYRDENELKLLQKVCKDRWPEIPIRFTQPK